MASFQTTVSSGIRMNELKLPVAPDVVDIFATGFMTEYRTAEPGTVWRTFGQSNPALINSLFFMTRTHVEYPGNIEWQFRDFTMNLGDFQTILDSKDMSKFLEAVLRGDDTVQGGSGSDYLVGLTGSDTIFGSAGNDTIDGGEGSSYLRGDSGQDMIYGGAQFDDINGNEGNDTCEGRDGNDWVVGGKDNDALFGGQGHDIVYGNMGDDSAYGDQGADIVRGGHGDDYVEGGDGDDFVSGDRGGDIMVGGRGADVFHFFAEAGQDVVKDFNFAEGDRIGLLRGQTWTLTSNAAGDAVIDLGNGDTITLEGVQVGAFPPGWIFEL